MLDRFFELMKKYEFEYNIDSSIMLAGRNRDHKMIVNIKYKMGEFVNTIPFEYNGDEPPIDEDWFWEDVDKTLEEQAKELLRTYTRSIIKEN